MRRFRIINLVCAFALLLQGLGPVGQVFASDVQAADGEFPTTFYICTAYGVKQVPVNGTPSAPVQSDSTDTCPLCQVHAAKVFLPTGGPLMPVTVTTLSRLHPRTGFFVLSFIGVTPTPPRGPPALLG